MKKKIVVADISEKYGNPLAELVQTACQFESEIYIASQNKKINAKSIMGIIAFNPNQGMEVDLLAEGKDEAEALDAMERFLICE